MQVHASRNKECRPRVQKDEGDCVLEGRDAGKGLGLRVDRQWDRNAQCNAVAKGLM